MIHYNCRHYVGSKPCKHKRTCDGCPHYDLIRQRILVIKLGALGDLLRTTTIIPALKKAYPASQITWITTRDCVPLLKNNPDIDHIWETDANVTARVLAETFDLMINFDKDTPAAQLASLVRATRRKGFAMSPRGELVAINSGSRYALELGIDDELKFKKNQLTYQQIIHQMADLEHPSPAPAYQLHLTDSEKAYGKEWVGSQIHQRETHRVLGINPGCGRVFATKKWHADRYTELATRMHEKHGIIPMLLGGPDESELIDGIFKELRRKQIPALRPGENLTIPQFASVISQCDAMICGDTLAMHLSLAAKVKTTVLFTSTCPQEIELYGTGQAIIGRAACSPCYLSQCKQPSQYCADSITVDEVYQAISAQMELNNVEEVRRSSNL